MKQNNLLASVALFSELYNSESFKSIPDILAEFIKGAIILENKYTFNSTELKEMMTRTYGFNIPESVLRTTLLGRMKDSVRLDNKNFFVEKDAGFDSGNITGNVDTINDDQNHIISGLYAFVEQRLELTLTEQEKNRVFSNFFQILMDNGYSDKYSNLISAYIITNERNVNFTEALNAIKEGLILYQGISYTADINELGSWNTELTLYLSTENLFNCLGYNGELFKEIFDDFYKLVIEINSNPKYRNRPHPLIHLKYFEETKIEIENFFATAETIFKGYRRLDPTREAMPHILKGVHSISDIKRKQIEFFAKLKQKGIVYQSFHFDMDDKNYNVLDAKIIEELKAKSAGRPKAFDEEYCINVLKIFTKINTFRRGKNSFPFENVGHLYLTENGFAKYLAHADTVKFSNYDIPFAKDLDFIISKFWFKLKKGFNNKSELPKSFDVVTKAKLIISSHISSSLSKHYDRLQVEFKDGRLTEEQALELSVNLKEKSDSAEEINYQNIDTSLNFLNDEDVIERFLREKTKKDELFEQTKQEKESLSTELKKYQDREKLLELEEAEKKYEKARKYFAKEQWKTLKKQKNSDARYYLLILLITILPIAAGILLKAIESLNEWMTSLGLCQYIIWGALLIIFIVETQGKAYLFNKEKIKSGWKWLNILVSRQKYKIFKQQEIEKLKSQFDKD